MSEKSKPAANAGAEQVQEQVAAETERGYRGAEVDPTPDENYTVAGVTKGAPTPETDDGARAAAAKRAADVTNVAE